MNYLVGCVRDFVQEGNFSEEHCPGCLSCECSAKESGCESWAVNCLVRSGTGWMQACDCGTV